MNDHFSLQSVSPLPDFKITGDLTRYSNTLAIRYELLGPLAELVIPEPVLPARKHGLWEATCFEFFLAVKHLPQYWEFNLSPTGDWNVYRFIDYRQGMQEEIAFTSLPFSLQNQLDALLLTLELDLTKIVQADQALEMAISTVIKHTNGEVTYWALSHHGPQADFHQRDSFIIEL